MTDATALDVAHAAMQKAPDDDVARLGFYQKLAASQLFLMLRSDATEEDDRVTPEVFELEDASYLLVFDREERLAAFTGAATPYVALSGRAIADMVAGQGIGLGLNLDVAPSSILLPPAAVDWLKDTLGNVPDEVSARISILDRPMGLPERFVTALDTQLATAMGLAQAAYVASVTYEGGARGHLLAFVGAIPQAEGALTRLAGEALTFSGIDAGAMDVAFFHSSDPVVSRLDRVGLRFDLPQLQQTVTQTRSAPGSDPAKPPKLK